MPAKNNISTKNMNATFKNNSIIHIKIKNTLKNKHIFNFQKKLSVCKFLFFYLIIFSIT